MENEMVSVVVVTYNSSQTILETLASIKIQTYRKYIEVVVADDCSEDDTISLVEDWAAVNKDLFNSFVVIKAEKNIGITKNFNQAVQNANGEYIKLLAGDDRLRDAESIKEYLDNMPEEKAILFTPVAIFGCVNAKKLTARERDHFKVFLSASKRIRKGRVFSNSIYSPRITGVFFRKSILVDMGYFDENYPMMEDYPFLVYVFEKRYDDIVFFDKQLYDYRVREKFSEEVFFSKRKVEHVTSLNRYRSEKILPLLYKEYYYILLLKTFFKMTISAMEVKNIVFGRVLFSLRKALKRG
ncbi:glycosyltransferase [Cysteiniphilum sp. QT6929]|uniref:glycosyltransferase family 2 protein n=1 Tax=Cysteiniphilum sp. QT6929 TaxID=2975055 RepID=UPI0024B363B9|nr:glycosyltransferase [Cysteiniphilum sp. QT6929]WHN66367.1 glycosyltransferase [Cysteiniphilum sp. QT6929]